MNNEKTLDFCWAFSKENCLRKESLTVFTFPHSISEAVVVIVKNRKVINAYQESGSSPRLGKPLISPSSAMAPLINLASEVAKVVARDGYHPDYTDVIALPFKPLKSENGVRNVFLFDPKSGAQLEIVLDKEDEPVNTETFPPRYIHPETGNKEYLGYLHRAISECDLSPPSDKMRELLENYHLLLG